MVKSEQQEEINNKNMGEEGKPTGGCEEPTQQVSGKRQFPFFCIEISPVSREFEVTACFQSVNISEEFPAGLGLNFRYILMVNHFEMLNRSNRLS